MYRNLTSIHGLSVYIGLQVTTFVSDECVSNFTGTSASAPLVSGVVALALEVK